MKIGKFVDVNQNNLKSLLNNEKIPGNILKNREKSWNFVSPEKWEIWRGVVKCSDTNLHSSQALNPALHTTKKLVVCSAGFKV